VLENETLFGDSGYITLCSGTLSNAFLALRNTASHSKIELTRRIDATVARLLYDNPLTHELVDQGDHGE
jgi:hypothetical protein